MIPTKKTVLKMFPENESMLGILYYTHFRGRERTFWDHSYAVEWDGKCPSCERQIVGGSAVRVKSLCLPSLPRPARQPRSVSAVRPSLPHPLAPPGDYNFLSSRKLMYTNDDSWIQKRKKNTGDRESRGFKSLWNSKQNPQIWNF